MQDQLNVLAGKIADLCDESGLPVLGFTILVRESDESFISESRTRTDNRAYIKSLGQYVLDEIADPSGWEPS